MTKISDGTKKERRKNAEVSITGTLPKETIERASEKTLLKIQRELMLPGFRKGTAPLGHVRANIGEKALWKESAEAALRDEAENILKEHEIVPIIPVSVSLVSGDQSDVPFEIIAVVAPTCSIENYKETAREAIKKVPTLFDGVGTPTPAGVGEKSQALMALRAQSREMTKSGGEGPLTDEEAKKLGFENSAAAELFLKEESERAVKEREVQRKRSVIAEALIEKAACDLPRVLIREEASSLLETMKKDIARQGVQFNEYLKQRNKTEDEVLKEIEAPAEKRVCLDLVFAEIARAEKIQADEKEEGRLAHTLVQQGVDHETAHRYVHATVMREKVWELLGVKAESRM